jgi:hypothetical protein
MGTCGRVLCRCWMDQSFHRVRLRRVWCGPRGNKTPLDVKMTRAYSIYLVSGAVVCVAVAVRAIIAREYLWLIVGVGGSVSCLVYLLLGRRVQEKITPNKSTIARWRDRKAGKEEGRYELRSQTPRPEAGRPRSREANGRITPFVRADYGAGWGESLLTNRCAASRARVQLPYRRRRLLASGRRGSPGP